MIPRWRWMNTSHTYQQLWTFIFGICGEVGASSTRMYFILQFVLWWLVDMITGTHSFMASHHKIFRSCSVSRTSLLKSSLQLGVVNVSPHSWKTFIGSPSSKGSGLSCLSTSTSVYTTKIQDISLTIFISTYHAGLDCDHLQTQSCSPFLNHQNWWLATDLSIWQDLNCGIQFLQQSGKQPPSDLQETAENISLQWNLLVVCMCPYKPIPLFTRCVLSFFYHI